MIIVETLKNKGKNILNVYKTHLYDKTTIINLKIGT